MKNLLYAVSLVVFLVIATSATAQAQCTKIQTGTLVDSVNQPISLGYDKYGYNYQAHIFNGLYDNYTRPVTPVASGNVNLIMKWSDDWLSNQDCNGDHKLDRGSAGVSQGWLTNHMEGDCIDGDGNSIHVTYFVKIVYVGQPPSDPSQDLWSGRRIWGVYAIIEEVGEDPSGGVCLATKGLVRSSLVNPAGFGNYTNPPE